MYEIRSKGIESLESVLKNKSNIKILEKNIHKICKNLEDYDSSYRRIIYQTVGDIIKKTNLTTISKNIKNNLVEWDHPIFTQIKIKLNEHDDFIVNPFEVEEGVTQCKCGSKRVFTYSKMVRSADEPMSTFAKCVECKRNWTYSG